MRARSHPLVVLCALIAFSALGLTQQINAPPTGHMHSMAMMQHGEGPCGAPAAPTSPASGMACDLACLGFVPIAFAPLPRPVGAPVYAGAQIADLRGLRIAPDPPPPRAA